MRITLGDGREIDCERPIERLPDGPYPPVLAAARMRTKAQIHESFTWLLTGFKEPKEAVIVRATPEWAK